MMILSMSAMVAWYLKRHKWTVLKTRKLAYIKN